MWACRRLFTIENMGMKKFEHNRACGGLELGKQEEPCHRNQMVVNELQYEIDKAFKKEFGEALSSGAVHELLARLALQNDSMYARFVEQQVRAQLAWQGG